MLCENGDVIVVIATLASIHLSVAGHCPEATDVEKRLVELLPRHVLSPDTAVVEETPDAITVRLQTAAGKTIGERGLPLMESCDERADAVAVTIASWEAEFPQGAGPTLTLPQPTPSVVRTESRESQLEWSVDASFLASIAGGSFAAGASADVLIGKRHFPLAARIGVAGVDTRSLSIGMGHAVWNRVAIVFGPNYEAVSRYVHVDIHADVLAGWLFVQGQGYTTNHGDTAFDPALGGGVRMSVARWDLTPWIDVALLGWLRTQTASATQTATTLTAEIPRFDVWLRAGVAYGRRK